MNPTEAAYTARCEPVVPFEYPREGDDSQNEVDGREIQIRALEFLGRIVSGSRTKKAADLRIGCALAVISGGVSVGLLASQHRVSWTRVEQVLKKLKLSGIS